MTYPVVTVEELARDVTARSAQARRTVVGIVGPPGSGKSTLAEQLVARSGGAAVLVPMDGFHLANVELARLMRASRKGAPDTFDAAGYVALLERVRAQRPDEIVYAPEFRREIEEPIAGAIPVLFEHRIVVTEGNYLLLDDGAWARVRPLIDLCWYLDVDDGVRLERLIARHMRFGRDADAARAWVAHTDEPNAVLIAATRSRADAIVRLA